jgi:hypothetical protein
MQHRRVIVLAIMPSYLVGFANSGGLVFVDESAEEIAAA